MTTVTMPEITGGISIDELTSADGSGVLDVMLGSIKTLLHAEYKENRIRGTDYANAFVQLIPAVLQQAGMYSLAKAKLPLELQLLEKEAQKADVDIQLATKQIGLTDAQIAQVGKQTDLLAYELTNLKPKELATMTEQVNVAKQEVALKTKQVEITNYELQHKLPVELEQMTAQTIKIVSDVNNTIKEGKLVDANRCRVNAETAMVTANLNQKLPKEIANMEKDLLIKQSQVDLGVKEIALKEQQVAVAVKELGIKDVELKLADYQFKYKAPVEVKKEQAEADYYKYRASSEQAQTDPSVILPGSVLDRNNKVLDEQSRQYLRSSQQTMLSSMLDTWKVRHNADPNDIGNAVDDENKLNDIYIGKIVTAVGNEVGITL